MKKIIEKIYDPKVGRKISWHQTTAYKLGDSGESFPFNLQIMDKNNQILQQHVVSVPANVMEEWSSDETITNYLLSQLDLELDLDNSVDVVLAKLNSGTITYASGTQEENDNILKNYALFLTLQIESFKEGSIEIDDFMDISDYNVNITLDSNTFSIKEFVKSLVGLTDAEKTSKLSNCVTAVEAIINEENTENNG
jgi:hypothetical protein